MKDTGAVVVVTVLLLDLQLPMQSVPAHGEVNLIQPSVIKLTCGRWVVFSRALVSSTNKTDCHEIIEILLKVVLNTITLTPILDM
jgi:hypothetical protein